MALRVGIFDQFPVVSGHTPARSLVLSAQFGCR